MVINNIELDVKTKCIEQGKTQVQIADDGGLGYDIEITYVKREV